MLHLVPSSPPPPSADKPEPVTRPCNVRLAGVHDEPAILDLLIEDLKENAAGIAPISIGRLASLIESGTRHRGSFALVIDGNNGEPVAVAILQLNQWWWSDTAFLCETVLYVSPPARHGHAGADLLTMAKWLAQSLSEQAGERIYLLAGVLGTKRIPAKLRLYSRLMPQMGGFFIYPPVEG